MSKVRIVLNGVIVPPEDIAGEPGIAVTLSASAENGSGGPLKKVSGNLIFSGTTAATIRTLLIEAPNGKNATIPIEFFDLCCTPARSIFKGVIRGDLLKWCDGECEVESTAMEDTEETRKRDCIRSTLIYDNWNGFTSQSHPKMVYCDEIRPEYLQYVLMIHLVSTMLIVMSFYPMVVAFWPVVTVINLIIDFINLFGADLDHIDVDGDPNTDSIEEFRQATNAMIADMMDCGRRHPSPLVRSYIKNVCDKCGVGFDSSILNNPGNEYWNLVYLHASAKHGVKPQDTSNNFIWENRPVKTLDMLLDEVADVFNARWRLQNGTVRFERRDKLVGTVMWLDVAALKAEGRLEEGVCYEWEKEDKPALLDITYIPDGLDDSGNMAQERYRETIEWNNPYSPVQVGTRVRQFRFGSSRYRNDGVERDVMSEFTWFPPIADVINAHKRVLLLSRGIASTPKLLIWDGADTNFGLVQRYDWPGFNTNIDQGYNMPMWLDEFNVVPETSYPQDQPFMSLYGRFHAIDNPRVDDGQGYTFRFTFSYRCADLESLDLWKFIQLPHGKGEIGEVTINPTAGTIIVTGKV